MWGAVPADRAVAETFVRERARLSRFIQRRVPDPADAEDILQEVFSELTQAAQLVRPVEQAGAWLFRVARNRITDLFRRRRSEAAPAPAAQHADETGEESLEDLLPSADGGPEAAYARTVMVEELEHALAELPAAQREVFLAHELEGRSFRELAAERGVALNTLLSQKHYAVVHLRRRLQAIYADFIAT